MHLLDRYIQIWGGNGGVHLMAALPLRRLQDGKRGKKKSKKEMGEERKGKRAGEGTGRHGGLDYAEGFLEALVVV
jgi:hypothetical protein